MNRKRFLMIGLLAVIAGLLASVVVYRSLLARAADRSPLTDIVVAARDLPVGTRMEEADLRLVKLPASELPDAVFHSKADIVGHSAVQSMMRGDLLLPNKLATGNSAAGMSAMIPKGMRAVPIRVSDIASVAGFVGPGTRVDVLSTGTPAGSNEPMTTTVLENVEVIATGGQAQRNGENAQGSPIVTLLVSPEDAQTLTLAASLGRIQLALRNPLDPDKSKPGATHNLSLFLGGAPGFKAPAGAQSNSSSNTARRLHPTQSKVEAPVIPPTYTVETIRGDKRDIAKVLEPKL